MGTIAGQRENDARKTDIDEHGDPTTPGEGGPGPNLNEQAELVAGEDRGMNFFDDDPEFARLLGLYTPPELLEHMRPHYSRLGELAGGRLDELAAITDRNSPTLQTRDRYGRDVQSIEYHPAYREMQKIAFEDFALASISHVKGRLGWPETLPHIAKYTLMFLFRQAEFSLFCPISMTDSAARILNRFGSEELKERFLPGLTSNDLGTLQQGGMFMTEMGAGSDVGATATVARNENGTWRLYGEKWFASNPDADVIVALARPEGAVKGTRGLGLFIIPKVLENGERNAVRIVRLKEKLGTRGMPSGEVVLEGAEAYPVGDLSKGFLQMTAMMNVTRLSNGVGAAAIMRRACRDARCAAETRSAFGTRILDFPLLQRQLNKIELLTEQAVSFFLYTANVLAKADAGDEKAGRLVRLLTALFKFRACRDTRKVTGDAMEIRGGCGYIEEYVAPRLLRDGHLVSIWEGTSNIIALDAMGRCVGKLKAEEALLVALRADFDTWGSRAPEAFRELLPALDARLEEAARFAREVAEAGKDGEAYARTASTRLYRATAGCLLAIEGIRLADTKGDTRRLELAAATLEHHLSGPLPQVG